MSSKLSVSNIELVGQGSSSTGNKWRYNDTTKRYEFYVSGFWFPADNNGMDSTSPFVGKRRVTFSYTGGAQYWSPPSDCTSIYVKMWGAGGGGAGTQGASSANWQYGANGGAGGHSRGIIPVTPGVPFAIAVGGGGYCTLGASGNAGYGWPSGGSLSNGNANIYFNAGGGGYTGIFKTSLTAGNELMIAGGGGGGGSSRRYNDNPGGAGGGLIGQDGTCRQNQNRRGRGGTQSAGGSAPTGGTTGGYFQGGNAANYGAGGGAGYYGGSGGSYEESYAMGGGGGGSGFIHSTVVMGETFRGTLHIPYGTQDPDYPMNTDLNDSNSVGSTWIAHGGGEHVSINSTDTDSTNNGRKGGPGFVVIYY